MESAGLQQSTEKQDNASPGLLASMNVPRHSPSLARRATSKCHSSKTPAQPTVTYCTAITWSCKKESTCTGLESLSSNQNKPKQKKRTPPPHQPSIPTSIPPPSSSPIPALSTAEATPPPFACRPLSPLPVIFAAH